MELGILEKSKHKGICPDDSESMHENTVEVLKISNSGDMKLAITKSNEPLPQKTSPLHYALQTSVIRNKRDCKIMPIARSNKMLQILSLRRCQEERLENCPSLVYNQAAIAETNVADIPKNDTKPQSLTRRNQLSHIKKLNRLKNR